MFVNNRRAFSNHACDLGKSNLVEMEIELTSDKPLIQAYRPIPHTVREQVKAILDQMIEYEILRSIPCTPYRSKYRLANLVMRDRVW
jgi:hypothetical protein